MSWKISANSLSGMILGPPHAPRASTAQRADIFFAKLIF
jgi:hypothetical protein